MNKEKIITILIGLLVGVGLAAIYFLAGNFLPQLNKTKPVSPIETVDNKKVSLIKAKLEILDPPDLFATTSATARITGKAQPGSTLVIYGNVEEKIIITPNDGNFVFDAKLEEGDNAISVTEIDEDGQITNKKRTIILEISQ